MKDLDQKADRYWKLILEQAGTSPTSLEAADAWMGMGEVMKRRGGTYEALWCYTMANAAYRKHGKLRQAFSCLVAFDQARNLKTLEWLRKEGIDDRFYYARSQLGDSLDVGVRYPPALKEAIQRGAVKVDTWGLLKPGPNPPEFVIHPPPPTWDLCEVCGSRLEAAENGGWWLEGVDPYCSGCHGQGYAPDHCVGLDKPAPERPEPSPATDPWILANP